MSRRGLPDDEWPADERPHDDGPADEWPHDEWPHDEWPDDEWPANEWMVRPVTGQASVKAYRCPDCQQAIRPGEPHLVVWPAAYIAGDPLELRRHWHTACWRRRTRPRPVPSTDRDTRPPKRAH